MRPALQRLLALVTLVAAFAGAGATVRAGDAGAATCTLPTGTTAQQWNKIAEDTVVGSGAFQNEALLYMGYTQGAVYDAATSILGGYEPYGAKVAVTTPASADAAVVIAAHDTLAYYFPSQAATLDCLRDAAVAAIGSGVATDNGKAVGSAAAAEIESLRAGDGRLPIGTIVPFTPVPGAAVWQPTVRTPNLGIGTTLGALPAQTPWIANVKPFVLQRPDQFLPDPPPALSSSDWADGFNELKTWGRATGSPRTAEQTGIALFWTTNVIRQYNGTFRDLATQHALNLLETVRLLAMGNIVAADAQIACMNAKYHYAFWRPITAIANAGSDGNPDTVADPTWIPTVTTPNHPEYPAAHGSLTSAMAEVFSDFLGTNEIDVTLKSATVSPDPANVPTISSQTIERPNDLRSQIVDARLWAGLHYRFSGVAGVVLGRQVAHYDLRHAFQPVGSPRNGNGQGTPAAAATGNIPRHHPWQDME